jgi:hypothetical protein
MKKLKKKKKSEYTITKDGEHDEMIWVTRGENQVFFELE